MCLSCFFAAPIPEAAVKSQYIVNTLMYNRKVFIKGK